MHELRFRQVHLDFHTSEHIPGIGSDFNPERFVATLKEAAVDSITCFSRCHHGWTYHPSKVARPHPHLTCNLLAEQIQACHAADIRVPIYVTVGWDHRMAREHPEWIEVDENGSQVGRKPLGAGWGWYNMDFASPYLDYVVAQTEEVCDMFGNEVDGLFFDILSQRGVHGQWCLQEFARLGWDPANPEHQERMRQHLLVRCTDRLAGAVRAKCPKATIFFNGSHIDPSFRQIERNYTHIEIESLPSGGWGYAHFPMTVRYSRTLGMDYLGMTGKFSESWGHFNSYKNPAALEYECFLMLAQGGKCSIGDQLHPSGRLDDKTYDLIGSVYRQVRDREPWCRGARSVTEIAVVNAEPYGKTEDRMDPRNLGAARMLIEGRHQFDFVDDRCDLSGYKVLILPDVIALEGEFAQKVERFVEGGGALIASHRSLLTPHASRLAPVASQGDLEFSPDFMRLAGEETDYVMYERGMKVEAVEGAEVLATIGVPYFNRSWDTFISHAHSPVKEATDLPAIVRKGRAVYFAHPVFTSYARHSMSFYRDAVLKVLAELLPDPLVVAPGPTSLQATMTAQGDRRIVHLLHYIPERRALNFDVVEDRLPLYDVPVSVLGTYSGATLQPQGEALEVRHEGGRTKVAVPVVDGHQMVVFE
ncbi:MAG TPA: alpha-amylase family protein [Fimbriimonas sp.]